MDDDKTSTPDASLLPLELHRVATQTGRALADSDWPALGEAIREGQALARRAVHPSLTRWLRIGALYNVVLTARGGEQSSAAQELRREVLALLGVTLGEAAQPR